MLTWDNKILFRPAMRLILGILVPAALLTVAGLAWLWPGKIASEPWTGPPHYAGEVIEVERTPCPELPEELIPEVDNTYCGTVKVRMHEGPDAGNPITTVLPSGAGAPVVEKGDEVILVHGESLGEPGVKRYDIIDHERGTQIWVLLLVFALTVIAFGRLRGLRALVGLAITFGVLLVFVVPAILQGRPPLLVAIVGSAAIMLIVLYLTHGFNLETSIAVTGTVLSLALTGALAAISTSALKLTGIADEQASFLTIQYGQINMLGLLLAGIVIGALGVLDDVTVTQASAVTELARANPALGFRDLYRGAARVGRAHITSVINTIVLAYAGASLPLLLLLTAGPGQTAGGWLQMVKSEQITQEIVRSVVGTLGLVAAVPITTALAALAIRGRMPRKPPRPRRNDPLENAWGLMESGESPADVGEKG